MKLRSILATAAATGLLASGAARAAGPAATGSVSFGQLTYTLTDLDPNDGVTPSITFLPLSTSGSPGSVNLEYFAGSGWKSDNVAEVGRQPVAASLSGSGVTVSGSFSGLDDPGAWSLDAYGSVTGGASGQLEASTDSGEQDFVLSPHTSLTVTATAHEALTIDPGASLANYSTGALLTLLAQDPAGQLSYVASPYSLDGARAPYDFTASTSVTYANGNASSVDGSVYLSTDVTLIFAGSTVSPVPEPAQLMLFAAGLPLLLGLRRRARRAGGAA